MLFNQYGLPVFMFVGPSFRDERTTLAGLG